MIRESHLLYSSSYDVESSFENKRGTMTLVLLLLTGKLFKMSDHYQRDITFEYRAYADKKEAGLSTLIAF